MEERVVLDRLNGWGRILVVGSVVWLMFVIGIKYDSFPTEESWLQDYRVRRLEILREGSEAAAERIFDCSGKDYPPDSMSYVNCLATNERIKTNARKSAWEQVSIEGERMSARIEEGLAGAQVKYIFFSILLWLIPIAVACALGFAVAWVRKGFARK